MRIFLLTLKSILYMALLLLAYAMNTTICPAIGLRGVTPDLLPFLLGYVTLFEGYSGGLAFGVTLGFV